MMRSVLWLFALLLPPWMADGADSPAPAGNVSLRLEARHAVSRGRAWLEARQNSNGCWSSADHPALTALVLTALIGPGVDKPSSPAIDKGYAWLLGCAQPDGGIYKTEVQSYNTSVALSALALRHRAEDQTVIQNARHYLIGLQVGGAEDDASSGGIGYGASEKRPDLSNTMLALEALSETKPRGENAGGVKNEDLNWRAALRFVQNCQNLPEASHQPWASNDPQNRGGFVYAPGRSHAGQTNLPSGRVALRSYGSISYAGLLSYIYADLKPGDPRVTAALDWLRGNYTVEENPGMGSAGLYYYYELMAKALTLAGLDTLETRDGRKINWREDLALKLLNLQKADGSWANDNGRWWEKDDVLDTAYAMTAMEIIENKL